MKLHQGSTPPEVTGFPPETRRRSCPTKLLRLPLLLLCLAAAAAATRGREGRRRSRWWRARRLEGGEGGGGSAEVEDREAQRQDVMP